MTKICIYCGCSFKAHYYNQQLCSNECAKEYVDLINKRIPFIRHCAECGKPFYSNDGTRFCSALCRQNAIDKDKEQEILSGKKLDSLDEILAYCKRVGITYAEYQIANTLSKMKKEGKQ